MKLFVASWNIQPHDVWLRRGDAWIDVTLNSSGLSKKDTEIFDDRIFEGSTRVTSTQQLYNIRSKKIRGYFETILDKAKRADAYVIAIQEGDHLIFDLLSEMCKEEGAFIELNDEYWKQHYIIYKNINKKMYMELNRREQFNLFSYGAYTIAATNVHFFRYDEVHDLNNKLKSSRRADINIYMGDFNAYFSDFEKKVNNTGYNFTGYTDARGYNQYNYQNIDYIFTTHDKYTQIRSVEDKVNMKKDSEGNSKTAASDHPAIFLVIDYP